MTVTTATGRGGSGWAPFLRAAILDQRRIGSVAPSSRKLADAMAIPPAAAARSILEIGAGTGSVTEALLDAAPQARIVAIERRSDLAVHLRARCPSVSVLEGDALEVVPAARRFDLVICSIPLTNLSTATVQALLGRMLDALECGGSLRFLRYRGSVVVEQVLGGRTRLRRQDNRRLIDEAAGHFRRRAVVPVWQNLPPAHVLSFEGFEPR